jgi:catechol 2,3-dioxygenase-like lactoylglutathione lyase family enzyme
VSHIGIVVEDLERAMDMYSKVLGVEWGPVVEFTSRCLAPSDLETDGLDLEGLREVASSSGTNLENGAPPPAAIQLIHAREHSPAVRIWGCPDGRHYVHHISYWVDDISAETARLTGLGFVRELYLPNEASMQIACLVSDAGIRIELQSSEMKEAAARFLATGEMGDELTADMPGLVIRPAR